VRPLVRRRYAFAATPLCAQQPAPLLPPPALQRIMQLAARRI
jgi:hypothetical protein